MGPCLSWAWGLGRSPWPSSPIPARPVCWKWPVDGPAAPSLGIPQGSDPAFILARSAVIGASGKKTKARCHCGRGLGFLTLFTLRLLGLVAGRLLKICVEFPSFSLETNKKARSTFPFPARPLRFPGSCPFLPLPKEYFPWRIWERFYFIWFDRAISKDEGSGCAPNVEKRSRFPDVAGTLAANAGCASPPPGTIRASCEPCRLCRR